MRLVLMISKLRDYDEMIQHPEAIDEGDLLQGRSASGGVRKTRFHFSGYIFTLVTAVKQVIMMPLPHCVYILFSHKDHLLYTAIQLTLISAF